MVIAAMVLIVLLTRQTVSNPSWEQPTMGTLCHITLSGSVPKNELSTLREQIDAALEKVNRHMSTWQSDTEISIFNALESSVPFPVSPEFFGVMRRALEISESTGGAFDPTVKPLVDYWGFGPGAEGDPFSTKMLEEIMESVGWQNVGLIDGSLVKAHPAVQLDLSAIAKGVGADVVAEVIRSSGLDSFLVEIGGEIVVSGLNPSGKPWRVGIESPQVHAAWESQVFQTVKLQGGAMATSGDYRNFRLRTDGTYYSHIMDPHTGRPSESDIASVSVLADSCMDADATATALFVMGSQKSFQWLEKHPEFKAFFILHSTNRTFTARATAGFPMDKQAGE